MDKPGASCVVGLIVGGSCARVSTDRSEGVPDAVAGGRALAHIESLLVLVANAPATAGIWEASRTVL